MGIRRAEMAPPPGLALSGYLDAAATTPPAAAVLAAMVEAQELAWANPSSTHGFGLAAAEALERSRERIATLLGTVADQVILCSGGSEAIHLALLGLAADLEPGRLVISTVEHPATLAAAAQLQRHGWEVAAVPVDRRGVVDLAALPVLLRPPTRLMSVIWGQNEVGTLQPINAIGRLCREARVLLHVDAVQVVGHLPVRLDQLPVDLLSCAAHKLQGPRGIGALLLRPGLRLSPLIGGGGQEGGRRGGTEPVVLAVGFAQALALAQERLQAHDGHDPLGPLRDGLLERLLAMEGIRLSGPAVDDPLGRLPHHLSLLVADSSGQPMSGRQLVRALWREGYAVSSGSACSSGRGAGAGGPAPSPVLLALGYGAAEAASGLRFSLGPWLGPSDLEDVPAALARARDRLGPTGAG